MIGALRRFLRALRLGRALLRLEAAERGGAAVMVHSSWCGAPGVWIALVRPAGWHGAALGKPIVGSDLTDVIERGVALTGRPARSAWFDLD